MNRNHTLLPLILLASIACSDKKSQTVDVPSYSEAASAYQEKSKAEMAKIAPEDLATMKQSAESLAKQLPDPGLKIGETAPDFSLPDANGKSVKLSGLLKQGPVVLVFYRGAWCPFCNMHLHVLNQSLPEFHRYGAQLVAITPQKPDKSAEQFRQKAYPFIVLSDLDNSVMQAYRLFYKVDPKLVNLYKNKFGLDLEEFNGPGRTVLPVPGTFVIDRQGIVRARHADTDYTKRMEPADIIQALKKL